MRGAPVSMSPLPPGPGVAATSRGLAAILTLWLAGAAAAGATEITADGISGFTERRTDGPVFTAGPGSTATSIALNFTVKASMHATFAAPGGATHERGLDALRSFVAGAVPLRFVENVIGSPSGRMSPAAGGWVLRQLDATAPGIAGGFGLANPEATEFPVGRNFARGDGSATPNPDTYPVSRSAPERIPRAQPANGNQVLAASLSSPTGTPGTPSFDVVAEAILDGMDVATRAGGASDRMVPGDFRSDGATAVRAANSPDFDLVERLVVCSANTEGDIATNANAFALDIGDATGRSVFGPFLGADPSATRMLSSAAVGASVARVW